MLRRKNLFPQIYQILLKSGALSRFIVLRPAGQTAASVRTDKKSRPGQGTAHACVAVRRLFGVTFLVFLYLLLQRIYGIVHRLLETFAAGLRHQVVAGNLYPDNGHLVTFLVVLVEFEDDIGPCRSLYESVEFSHFCLYEFDELPVGIEFNCLNLYVHN